jgi:hypothetical protein
MSLTRFFGAQSVRSGWLFWPFILLSPVTFQVSLASAAQTFFTNFFYNSKSISRRTSAVSELSFIEKSIKQNPLGLKSARA